MKTDVPWLITGGVLGLAGLGFAAFNVWQRFQAEDGAEPMNTGTEPVNISTLGYIGGMQVVVNLLSIGNGKSMHAPAANAFNAMKAAAIADGVTLFANSAFRSMAEQEVLYQRYLKGGNLAAKPGYSNHQSGISVDISTNGKGRDSVAYKWLAANAKRFGFVNDVAVEPWHWTWEPGKALLKAQAR